MQNRKYIKSYYINQISRKQKIFKGFLRYITTVGSCVLIIILGTKLIAGATTIGANISTTGTLDVTGASTLIGNTSVTGTLTVTALTTLGNASTTLLSISNTAYIGGSTGLVLADGSITDLSGAISFGDENLTTTGNIGIGTSSPYAPLSVVGEIVGSYFTATSTTATSTFSSNVDVEGSVAIKNSGKISMQHTALAAGVATSVQVAPYDTAEQGSGSTGVVGNETVWWLNLAHHHRIRQTGDINQFKLWFESKENVTSFELWIWRYNGSTYDKVGSSANVIDLINPNTVTTVSLPTTISAQRGDYIGWKLSCSASCTTSSLSTHTDANADIYYHYTTEPSATNYDWASEASLGSKSFPIEIYMNVAPQVVFIGDSIVSGLSANYSFLETTETTDLTVSMAYHFNQLTGYTYQNLGRGGQTTTNIEARFDTGCGDDLCAIDLSPRLIVIEMGHNDILNNDTINTFITNYTSVLNAADTANIPVVALGIPPWTGSTARLRLAERMNMELINLIAGYDNAIYVDLFSYLGVNNPSGDDGNLWSISTNPDYDDDGVHFTSLGYSVIAQAILDGLNAFKIEDDGGVRPVFVSNEGGEGVGIGAYPLTGTSTLGYSLTVNGKLKTDRSITTGVVETSPVDYTATPVYPTSPVKFWGFNKSVADDGSVTLPSVTTNGYGIVVSGDATDRTQFWVDDDGDIILLNNAGSVASSTDSDTDLCIGTSATQEPLIIKNRLGATKVINIMFWYD